jgi:hypothetical protein
MYKFHNLLSWLSVKGDACADEGLKDKKKRDGELAGEWCGRPERQHGHGQKMSSLKETF